MRLGFHYHVPAFFERNEIRMPAYQGRFVDALAENCSEITCFLHSPLPHEQAQMDYRLLRRNVRLVNLGPHCSIPRRLISSGRISALVRIQRSLVDAVLLRGPSPLLPVMSMAVRPLPTALLLVGDAVAALDGAPNLIWRRIAMRLLWRWNRHRQDQVAKHSLTFVNSRKLFRELQPYVPELLETRTTTLTREDFFDREDTCMQSPCRLLYTGRLTRSKGLFEMLKAFALLVHEGEDLMLDLVGWQERGENVLEDLNQMATRLQVLSRVKVHNPKAAGPELYAHYRESDIYVIASKSDFEGFPRTIWEAMAHSLPVVATRVGSIPDFVQDAALLIKPDDIQELVGAIRRILHDPIVRRQMIRRGREIAAPVTLERQTSAMVEHIKSWAKLQ